MVEEFGDEERLKQARDSADETLRAARDEPVQDSNHKPARRMLPRDCDIRVVCLPAHDEADEIVGVMLAQLLGLRNFNATPVSHNALASEMLDAVEKRRAQIICVSALPPAAVAHARYLLKRIVPRFVEVEPVVGLWTIQGDLKRAAQRISAGAVESVPVITNLTQAIEQISRLAEPLQLAKSEPAISLSSPQPRP